VLSTFVRTIVLASFMVSAACISRPVNTVGPPTPPVNEPDYGKVTVSGWLNAKCNVFGIRRSNVNGVLCVQLDVRNLTPMAQKVEYEFVWLDPNGIQVGATSTRWYPLTLEAGQVKHIQEVAPTNTATDFRAEFRGRR